MNHLVVTLALLVRAVDCSSLRSSVDRSGRTCYCRDEQSLDNRLPTKVYLTPTERPFLSELVTPFNDVLKARSNRDLGLRIQEIIYRTALDFFGIDFDESWGKEAFEILKGLHCDADKFQCHETSPVKCPRPAHIYYWIGYWMDPEFCRAVEMIRSLGKSHQRDPSLVSLMNELELKYDDLFVCFCGMPAKKRWIARMGMKRLVVRFGLKEFMSTPVFMTAVDKILLVFRELVPDNAVRRLLRIAERSMRAAWDDLWSDPVFDQVSDSIIDLMARHESPLDAPDANRRTPLACETWSSSGEPLPDGLFLWDPLTRRSLTPGEEKALPSVQSWIESVCAGKGIAIESSSVALRILVAMIHRFGLESADERLSPIDKRLSSIDKRLSPIDEGLRSVDERLSSIDERLGSVFDQVVALSRSDDSVFRELVIALSRPENGSEDDWMQFFETLAFESISPSSEDTYLKSVTRTRVAQECAALKTELEKRLLRPVPMVEAIAVLEVLFFKYQINPESPGGRSRFLKIRHALLSLDLSQEFALLNATLTADHILAPWNTVLSSRQFDDVAHGLGVDLSRDRDECLQRMLDSEAERRVSCALAPLVVLDRKKQIAFLKSLLEFMVRHHVSSTEAQVLLMTYTDVFEVVIDLSTQAGIQRFTGQMLRIQVGHCGMELKYILRVPPEERHAQWKQFLTGWVFLSRRMARNLS